MAKESDDDEGRVIASPSKRRTEKFLEARETLPDDLREIYDDLVDEYHFATIQKFGGGYVAYAILAEMVRLGWRKLDD